MKRFPLFPVALATLAALLTASFLPAQPSGSTRITLARAWNFNGAAAADEAIVATAAAADSTSYTIAAQPDTPRQLQVVVVDADSSILAGTITVVGTDAYGAALTGVATFAGGGSTDLALSPSPNFATVTSVTSSALTGEGGGDTISVGTTATIPAVSPLYYGGFTRTSQGQDVASAWQAIQSRVALSPAAGTSDADLVSTVASSGAFAPVRLDDLLLLNVRGTMVERRVITRTDDDTVVVDSAVDFAALADTPGGVAAGLRFFHKHFLEGTGAEDGWISVGQFVGGAGKFQVNVDQIDTATGVVITAQCREFGDSPIDVGTDTVTTAGVKTYSIDFRLAPFDQCRVVLAMESEDDGTDTGAAAEDISITFTGVTK